MLPWEDSAYDLEEPFVVIATQNPIEQEGTYPLPEAQLDRFMMEIRIDYPTPQQEREIVLKTTTGPTALPTPTFERDAFLQLRNLVWAVPLADHVVDYAVRLCGASRPGGNGDDRYIQDYIAFGAGPRGSQNLVLAAKARALLMGRTTVTTDDVRTVAPAVLRHRMIVNHRAIGDDVNAEIGGPPSG